MASLLATPAIWVDNQIAFDQAYDQLKASTRLGIDTESNSLHAYKEQVCLIQVTDNKADYIIDSLADMDLSRLSNIFADSGIEKIFHAAEYDILCLKRDYGFEFTNLFDTMQAARILGIEKIGLSTILSDLMGIDQGKSFQKANWGKRPLTEEMRQYARLDTHYLFELRNILAERLEQKNLMKLAQEDFRRLCKVEPTKQEAPLYTHISGYHLLQPQALAVLDELCKFRDRRAEKLDRPHFKVIGNNVLLAVAEELPRTTQELIKINGVSPKMLDRHQQELLNAVKLGLSNPPISVEKRKRPSQAYIDRLEVLHDWRKDKGKKLGVQSDIVLPRDILEDIAANNPQNLQELKLLMDDVPWRFKHFGRDIIKVIENGKSK